MGKGEYLGELEEVVLLTVCILQDEAYGVTVRKEVEKRTGRNLNISAIHSTLYRLERKGLLQSRIGEATKIRGGKRKKFFTPTSAGVIALNEVTKMRNAMWAAIPKTVLKGAGL